jgi:hypothetical protein
LVSTAKKPSTAFSQEALVEGDARVASEPGDHLGMFVGGIVVEDDVDGLLRRNRFLDAVEEADELLMAMALHTHRPITLPSNASRATNSVAIP